MRKRNLMIALAVAAIAAGVIIAVTRSGAGHGPRGRGEAARAARPTEAQAAAAYLGLSREQLRKQLQSGRTLAQIADASGGRSATGLVEALLRARVAKLEAAVRAKRLSVADERRRVARLRIRLEAQLERSPGYANLAASAHYLGLSAEQLRSDLRARRSLAQVAAATPGKSAAGLIEARVSAQQANLEAALASGKISRATERLLASSLRQRITAEVQREPTR
jgi:hypothetical protein